MSDTPDTPDTSRPVYRAMHMLTGEFAPRIKKRDPFWRPKAAPCSDKVRLPLLTWTRPRIPAQPVWTDADLITMDVNAAYLAACSSAQFPYGQLENAWDEDFKRPGLYLVDAHPWTNPELCSPLGTQTLRDHRVWVAAPTVKLLNELSVEGWWPPVVVHDAWTSHPVGLRKWVEAVKADRNTALMARQADAAYTPGDYDDYEAIKDGYAICIQTMKGPREGDPPKSSMKRPDWYQTVHAQHAATLWRKAWNTVLAGHGPVRIGSKDEVSWLLNDMEALIMAPMRPVIRIDPTGTLLGAFKVKPKPGEGE